MEETYQVSLLGKEKKTPFVSVDKMIEQCEMLVELGIGSTQIIITICESGNPVINHVSFEEYQNPPIQVQAIVEGLTDGITHTVGEFEIQTTDYPKENDGMVTECLLSFKNDENYIITIEKI